MAGLLELLSKKPTSSAPGGEPMPSEPIGTEGGFESSAAMAMDSLKNNDVPGFSEALKACIQMGG